jgi:outer membrane protein assembly factor BamD
MLNFRHITLIFILGVFSITGCDNYNKVLKSNDIDLKMEKAKEYYNKGNYYKAIPLLDELIAIYRGQPELEGIYYMYCNAHYGQGNYILAAYHFKNFYSFYPNNENAENAMYMVAKCNFEMSPEVELDQTYTEKAIESFQLYINAYPLSERVDEANQLIDKLRDKLEYKAFLGSKLYYDMGLYLAAAQSFENLIEEFPDFEKLDEIYFYIVKAYYFYAKNSILSKQKERYNSVINTYNQMVMRYPESTYLKDALSYYKNAKAQL